MRKISLDMFGYVRMEVEIKKGRAKEAREKDIHLKRTKAISRLTVSSNKDNRVCFAMQNCFEVPIR